MTKKAPVTRILLCLAVITLVGATAMASDNAKSTITINGGRNTVFMGASHASAKKAPCTPAKFYDNICNGTINMGSGWTVSDGSPINTEFTPGGQFQSAKSGTIAKIVVTVGWVTGTNAATIDLDADCAGVPCGNADGSKHLCQGKLSNMYTFGQPVVPESFKCKKKTTLKAKKLYWVYVQGASNSWSAWNQSAGAGLLIEGTDDVWGSPSQSVLGGLAVH